MTKKLLPFFIGYYVVWAWVSGELQICCKNTFGLYWVNYYTFVSMSKKPIEWENVKVRKTIVDKLRTHKKETGVSIMAFVELAVLDRLSSKIKKSAK